MTVNTLNFSDFADEQFDKEIHTIAKNVREFIQLEHTFAAVQIGGLAKNVDMITAVKEKDRLKIKSVIDGYTSDLRCTFFSILDTEGRVMYRYTEGGETYHSSNPEESADPQLDLRSVNEVLSTKKPCIYFESTPDVRISIRAAAPVFDEKGTLIGVVSGGYRGDTDGWVDEVQRRYRVHCSMFLNLEQERDAVRIATTLRVKDAEGKDTHERAVGTMLDNFEIYDKVFYKKDPYWGDARVMGIPMKVHYEPLFNNKVDTHVMGMLFVGIPTDSYETLVRKNLSFNITITAIGVSLFAAILFWIVHPIVAPIRKIAKAAEDLADGHLDVDLHVNSKDETAILAKSFKNLSDSLKAKTEVAISIANGDLTVWVPLRSEHDALGLSLIRMRYSLYDSIKDLEGLAVTVGEEARSLSNVNESLVANSSHSAEQLKTIKAAIRSFHAKTEQNAGDARNVENLTQAARDGSNDGKEKMGRMMQAMETITKSSDEIKKIIRVIDDIAFQTNLLALNAAVEAARAGQHGKGFAVVAEEVRNLAARSAKAANETAELIEESIQQVEFGSGVARETSDSLNQITEQIEQISKIVATISEESDDQAKGLGEMTHTIARVSATADANMESVGEVTKVISSVSRTAKKLDVIIKHFQSNEDGRVMVEGKNYEGFVPSQGSFPRGSLLKDFKETQPDEEEAGGSHAEMSVPRQEEEEE
jgi:methyl-accepting chemotaxis protein